LPVDWLKTQTGQNLLQQEQFVLASALERVFGDQLLQIGSWGPAGLLLEGVRTQFAAVVGRNQEVGVRMVPERLAIATDSVDALLLPHTLEFSPDPHAVLREVHRVLRPDGKLLVIGFNPLSWWGLRHRLSPRGYPPGVLSQLSRRRLTDWLRLLNISINSVTACYSSPDAGNAARLLRRTGWFASAYVLVATKQTLPMTIIRPRARRRPNLVRGLVTPTTRTVA
jgi:SAM-dependent methyltransferase